jgi:hypothetical protein
MGSTIVEAETWMNPALFVQKRQRFSLPRRRGEAVGEKVD